MAALTLEILIGRCGAGVRQVLKKIDTLTLEARSETANDIEERAQAAVRDISSLIS
jgi:hypothetical protein